MDLSKAIRLAVDTGKVTLGSDKTRKALLSDQPKLVILAANCEKNYKGDVLRYAELSGVPVVEFNGSSLELGNVCGKPFPVQALSVFDAGTSNVLEVIKPA